MTWLSICVQILEKMMIIKLMDFAVYHSPWKRCPDPLAISASLIMWSLRHFFAKDQTSISFYNKQRIDKRKFFLLQKFFTQWWHENYLLLYVAFLFGFPLFWLWGVRGWEGERKWAEYEFRMLAILSWFHFLFFLFTWRCWSFFW